MVRRADQHHVDPVVIEQPAVVNVPAGDVGVDVGSGKSRLTRDVLVDVPEFQHVAIDVGHGDDAAMGPGQRGDHRSLIPQSDDADAGACGPR